MASPVLQFRRGLFSNLPALRAGEPGFATDTSDFYIGLTSQSVNNKFFGSSRYWTKDTSSTGSAVRVVEGTSNGSNYIEIKSPDALAGNLTYTLPGLNGANGTVLTNDGSGNLSWVAGSINSVLSGVTTISGSLNNTANNTFSGVTTVTNTTNNTLGNADTGAVQIDGGLGVNQNVTIGGSFYVAGHSEFVGVVTFRGGTINLGDGNTDDIVVSGEFASSLIPTTDATYDIGDGANSKRWRHTSFSGVGTFGTAVVVGTAVTLTAGGIVAAGATINNLRVTHLNVSGVTTTTGDLTVGGDLTVSGNDIKGSGGTTALTFTGSGNVTVAGDLEIDGNDIKAADSNTNITLTSNTLTTFAGDIRVNGNDIQASDGNTNITMTSNTLTTVAGDLKVTGNDIQSSSATAITLSGADVTVAGDLQVTGNDIKSSTGAVVATLSANDVTFADDVTVSGNLYVNGSTTQVNTTSLTVEDSLIEVGLVDGNTPSSDLNKDLGLLLNYYTTSAKKAAVYWDDSTSRIVVASDVSESSSVLTATTYADFEIGSLYVNDCAGSSKVITCTGSERLLENITIDGGAF